MLDGIGYPQNYRLFHTIAEPGKEIETHGVLSLLAENPQTPSGICDGSPTGREYRANRSMSRELLADNTPFIPLFCRRYGHPAGLYAGAKERTTYHQVPLRMASDEGPPQWGAVNLVRGESQQP